MNIYRDGIDENYSILTKGCQDRLEYVLLSTITVTLILDIFVEIHNQSEAFRKIIDCFSLTRLFSCGSTLDVVQGFIYMTGDVRYTFILRKLSSFL